MPKKTVQILADVHSNLRKEAADIGVEIQHLAAFKLKKPLSKEEIIKIKNEK